MCRDLVFSIVRQGMEAGEFHLVLAHLATTLESYERQNILGFTAEQAAELKALLQEARRRARESEAPNQRSPATK